MAASINASTSAGVVTTADTSGNLNLQSNGTTIIGYTSAGAAVTGTLTGSSTMFSPITNSLSGNVALNNTATFFTGPTVAQGTSGTWFVSGTVTMIDNTGAGTYFVKLWDGTTVIASTVSYASAAAKYVSVALSGFMTSPAGNLRISVKNTFGVSGTITANDGSMGNFESTITAVRIG